MMHRSLVIFLSLTTPIWARAHLVSVVQVFRHGERVPIRYYPNDPYKDRTYWPAARGQLTNTGKIQLYHLGQYTRNRYKDTLPAAYASNIFYAQTTDLDRTHMSAQCNLLGLFPPTKTERWNPDIAWSPIPVHLSNPNAMHPFPPCPAFDAERERVSANESYFKKIDKQYQETYKYLSKYSGTTITKLGEFRTVFDCLFTEHESGFILPSWTKEVYPEPLTALEGFWFQTYVYNTKLTRLSAGLFLNEVVEHFEKMKTNSSSSQFFRVYSGHDFNIAKILAGLGAFDPHFPYYASTIYFELWELLGQYYVNVYYKNKDTVSKVTSKGCSQFDCNFDEFKMNLADILINTDNWKKECEA